MGGKARASNSQFPKISMKTRSTTCCALDVARSAGRHLNTDSGCRGMPQRRRTRRSHALMRTLEKFVLALTANAVSPEPY